MRAEGGKRIFFRIFGTEERQVNEIDIFVRHAKRAITGGGGPGILAKESDNIAPLSKKYSKDGYLP